MASLVDWSAGSLPLPLLGISLLGSMILAAIGGFFLRRRQDRADAKTKQSEGQEGLVVSAVLGLLAFLLGFTFSLATDRFEARRQLVLEESNAIGTAYLRSQLLGEPHRSRLSQLLVAYTENKILLAKAQPDQQPPLLATDDQLLTSIWAATAAAFDSIKGLDFSSAFVDSMNSMIDLDASRRAARMAHVPSEVFGVLFLYMIVSAVVLGYVLSATRGRLAGGFLMVLFTIALLLIVDIDRPTLGGINESQRPMEKLLESLKSQPISVYDRWRGQDPAP
jgi:protein-S-isoprenylcysteine O-methyltransferase Ste14